MKPGEDNQAGEDVQGKARVSPDVAELEVEKWLNLKRVSKQKREQLFESNIKTLEELVTYGSLLFDFERKKATYTLQVPITVDNKEVRTLDLRFFLGAQQAKNILNNVAVDDMEGRTLAIISALSGMASSILFNAKNELGEAGIDVGDLHTLKHYALFFLG